MRRKLQFALQAQASPVVFATDPPKNRAFPGARISDGPEIRFPFHTRLVNIDQLKTTDRLNP
jgi:hypothetical protein